VAPPLRALAWATLARIELSRGAAREALEAAEAAYAILASPGGLEEGESLVRLAWAEALEAAGRHEEARAALAAAAERLRARADRISAPEVRERFLTAVPENARTLELGAAAREPG
jgi:tetratricopeptide (TPR) repeat protein